MANENIDLRQLSCSKLGCSKDTPSLKKDQVAKHLASLTGWKLCDATIYKTFQCSSFEEALGLMHTIGTLAETENHHPDIHIYDSSFVRFTLTTHAIHALSLLDFVLAAKIDALAPKTAKGLTEVRKTNESCLSEWTYSGPQLRKTVVAKNFKMALFYVDQAVKLAAQSGVLPDIFITNYRTVALVLKDSSSNSERAVSSELSDLAGKISKIEGMQYSPKWLRTESAHE